MKRKSDGWKSFRIREKNFDILFKIAQFQRRKMSTVIETFLNDYYKENKKEIEDFLKNT